MSNETWIVFKADNMSAPGWEERKLLPSGGLTDILWENWDSSGKLPQVGTRVREYADLESSGSITHGREGDWVVTSIHQFSSFDTDNRIVVCHCQYQPVAPEWEKLHRGVPVDELQVGIAS